MRRRRFYATVDFVVNIIRKMQVGEDLVHIGAVVFSDEAEVVFGLDEFYDGQDVVQAMKTQMKYRRGRTNIVDALNKMVRGNYMIQCLVINITQSTQKWC